MKDLMSSYWVEERREAGRWKVGGRSRLGSGGGCKAGGAYDNGVFVALYSSFTHT